MRVARVLLTLVCLASPALAQTQTGSARKTAEPTSAAASWTEADGQNAYLAGDYARAYAIWSALAPRGDNSAALGLGALLDVGQGVARDPAAALHWYRVAAERGVPDAEFDVGIMLDSGRGAARDMPAAATWYARAAAHGQRRAQYNLGQLYAAGEGVPQNGRMAAAWYRLAASSGIAAASSKLSSEPNVPPTHLTATTGLRNVTPQAPSDNQRLVALPPDGAVEFVWTAPAQPVPVIFFVEVDLLTAHAVRLAASRYVAESATLLQLGAAPADYVWRVYVVDRHGQRYSLGGWKRFSIVPSSPAVSAGAP